jgi:hypothetical protein
MTVVNEMPSRSSNILEALETSHVVYKFRFEKHLKRRQRKVKT